MSEENGGTSVKTQPRRFSLFTLTQKCAVLYIYRAFALEYHKKQEAARMEQIVFANKPSIVNMPDRAIDGKTGFQMAINDFEEEKIVFDTALLTHRYDVLTSIIWEFDGFSNFAVTAGEAPMSDFSGKKIQDLLNPHIPARHIYLCVFPENDKTYTIIAWLKEYDALFASIKDKLDSLNETQKKNYINNTIPIIAENLIVKPSSWDAMPETAKQAFTVLFWGMADFMEMDGQKYNRFDNPSFDLFSL